MCQKKLKCLFYNSIIFNMFHVLSKFAVSNSIRNRFFYILISHCVQDFYSDND